MAIVDSIALVVFPFKSRAVTTLYVLRVNVRNGCFYPSTKGSYNAGHYPCWQNLVVFTLPTKSSYNRTNKNKLIIMVVFTHQIKGSYNGVVVGIILTLVVFTLPTKSSYNIS